MLISILYAIHALPNQAPDSFAVASSEFIPYTEHYTMSGTAYTIHPDCIKPEWNDGITATGTDAREGIVAINIDIDEKGKVKVRSVLKLGQTVYVKGQFIEGVFTVEDTGYFRVKYLEDANPKDLAFDTYNLDFFLPTIGEARGFGIQYPIEVYVIEEG
jgi:3D (Asp-Asp-Asp) domain-containing protein